MNFDLGTELLFIQAQGHFWSWNEMFWNWHSFYNLAARIVGKIRPFCCLFICTFPRRLVSVWIYHWHACQRFQNPHFFRMVGICMNECNRGTLTRAQVIQFPVRSIQCCSLFFLKKLLMKISYLHLTVCLNLSSANPRWYECWITRIHQSMQSSLVASRRSQPTTLKQDQRSTAPQCKTWVNGWKNTTY